MSAFRLVTLLGVVAVLATGVVTGQSGTPTTNPQGRARQAAGLMPAIQPEPRTDLTGDPLPPGAIGRLGSTRLRHGAFIRAAAFLPEGKMLAALDDDGIVYLWNSATGKERRHYAIGPWPAASAFSPDGRLIACSNGHESRLYDLATGKVLHQHGETPRDFTPNNEGRRDSDPLVGFSGDSRIMTSASIDRSRIHFLETSTGKELRRLNVDDPRGPGGVLDFTLSHDGKLLATVGFGGNPSGAVWDASTGKRLYGFRFSQEPLPVFAPDGKTFADVSAHQKQVVVCEAATGKQLHAFGFFGAFHAVAFSPDGKTLAALDGKGRSKIRIWDVSSGAALGTLKAQDASYPGVNRLAFTRDGRRLLCASESNGTGYADAVVQLWELPADRDAEPLRIVLRSGPATPFTLLLRTAPVQFALSDDNATLAVTTANCVRLWDIATGKEQHAHPGHQTHVTEVAVSPDGRQVATGGPDGVIHLWDARAHKELARWLDDRNRSPLLAFAADGKTLTCGCRFGDAASIWELPAARLVHRQAQGPPQGSEIRALAPDGRTVAWVTQDGLVSLLDVATDKEQIRLHAGWDPRQQLWGHPGAFSADGKRFALSAMAATDPTILQWDLATGRKLPTLAGIRSTDGAITRKKNANIGQMPLAGIARTVGAITYSSDGRIVAAVSSKGAGTGDLRVWEAASGKECLRIERPTGSMLSLAFTADGRRLAVGFADGSIRVWDLATGKQLGRRDGHRGAVWSLQFSPDGQALYSASADTTVLIWDMPRLPPPLAALPAGELQPVWADLASADAPKAYSAVWALAGAPKQAVPFLKGRLSEAIPDDKQVQRWIAELDSDNFDTREAAVKELTQRGELIEPAALEALKGKVSLEARRRLEQLLKTMPVVPPPEGLRVLRALQVLELIGSAEAQLALQALAKGAPGARQTREAQESLDRLAKRAASAADH